MKNCLSINGLIWHVSELALELAFIWDHFQEPGTIGLEVQTLKQKQQKMAEFRDLVRFTAKESSRAHCRYTLHYIKIGQPLEIDDLD